MEKTSPLKNCLCSCSENMSVHNISIMFLVLCVNGEENVEQEECDDSKVARMMECAGRQEIVHLTTFRCYQPNTQGPCQNGEVFVLGDNEVREMLFINVSITELFLFCDMCSSSAMNLESVVSH